MTRLSKTLHTDVRYQYRYGFYFIYAFMIAFFVLIVRLIPQSWHQTALAVVLLSDPALLGFFFIGGLLQLERGEGLLYALFQTPLRPHEYLLSKAASLGLLSTLAGCLIALLTGAPGVRYALLIPIIFVISATFTLFGVGISINLKTMNAFLSIHGSLETTLMIPVLLMMLGVNFPLLKWTPTGAGYLLVQSAIGGAFSLLPALVAIFWLCAAFFWSISRLNDALERMGGGVA